MERSRPALKEGMAESPEGPLERVRAQVETETYEVPAEDGTPLALVTHKRIRTRDRVLLEEEVLWRDRELELMWAEERVGEERKFVWRELPTDHASGRTWLAEGRGPRGPLREEAVGSLARPVRSLESPYPLLGPLELTELLRAGGLPEGRLALLDGSCATWVPCIVRPVDVGLAAQALARRGQGALRAFECLEPNGRILRRLLFQDDQLLGFQWPGRSAWARPVSSARAEALASRWRKGQARGR